MELTVIVQSKIYEIRGRKVMIDKDLAELYQIEVKRLNESVKRNVKRFPLDFMFQLTTEEWQNLKSQIATSREVFTDQNDINDDTRMQLELINRTLAEMQAQRKASNKPRNPISFKKPE